MKAQRGFTLIELAVVLTVMGLLLSLCAHFLHLGGSVWDKTNANAEGMALVEPVQVLLRNELTQAVPVALEDSDRPAVSFSGTSDVMHFRAVLPQALESHGIVPIKLSVKETSLVFSWRQDKDAAWKDTVLFSGADSLAFEYLDSGAGWKNMWEAQAVMPNAVRISVRFPAGDSRRWPDLIVAPVVMLDSAEIRSTIKTPP